MADEPTSDLDERTESEVMDIFREINASGASFLVVTHNPQLRRYGCRTYEMENGTLKLIKVI